MGRHGVESLRERGGGGASAPPPSKSAPVSINFQPSFYTSSHSSRGQITTEGRNKKNLSTVDSELVLFRLGVKLGKLARFLEENCHSS